MLCCQSAAQERQSYSKRSTRNTSITTSGSDLCAGGSVTNVKCRKFVFMATEPQPNRFQLPLEHILFKQQMLQVARSAAKCRNDSYSKRSTRNTKYNSKRINNLCAGGSVTLTSSAGSSYLLWSTGATTQSIPANNREHIRFKD
jgi:hypothetical protein